MVVIVEEGIMAAGRRRSRGSSIRVRVRVISSRVAMGAMVVLTVEGKADSWRRMGMRGRSPWLWLHRLRFLGLGCRFRGVEVLSSGECGRRGWGRGGEEERFQRGGRQHVSLISGILSAWSGQSTYYAGAGRTSDCADRRDKERLVFQRERG